MSTTLHEADFEIMNQIREDLPWVCPTDSRAVKIDVIDGVVTSSGTEHRG